MTTQEQVQAATAYEQGYFRGNFCAAYEALTLDVALAAGKHRTEGRQSQSPAASMAGFVLGFFSSYELHEIPAQDKLLFFDALTWAEAQTPPLDTGRDTPLFANNERAQAIVFASAEGLGLVIERLAAAYGG